jgi:hypothetical protein
VEVYARVRRAIQVDGMSIRQASREFGLARKMIRKMLASPGNSGIRYPKCRGMAGRPRLARVRKERGFGQGMLWLWAITDSSGPPWRREGRMSNWLK